MRRRKKKAAAVSYADLEHSLGLACVLLAAQCGLLTWDQAARLAGQSAQSLANDRERLLGVVAGQWRRFLDERGGGG